MMRRAANKSTMGQGLGQVQPQSPLSPAAPRSSMQRAYTMALGALAVLAGGYLTVLVAKPDMLTVLIAAPVSDTGTAEPMFDSEAEIAALRTSVNQLQTDITRTRSDINVLANNDRAFENTVGAIEHKIDGLSEALRQQAVAALQTGSVAKTANQNENAPRPEAETAKVLNKEKAQPAAERETIVATPKAKRPAAEAAAPASPRNIARQAQLETGSLGPAQGNSAAAKPAAKPAGKPFGLMITSAPSVDALRLYWSLVSDQHGGDLSGLDPRYVAGGGDGASATYNLVAGPIGSKAEARRKCKQLTEKGVTCQITEFGGNAL